MEILIAIASFILGIVIAYLIVRMGNRHRAETDRLGFENELNTVNLKLQAASEKHSEEKARFETLNNNYLQLTGQFHALSNENTALLTTVENERAAAADKLKSFLEAQEALKDAFSSLSMEALRRNSATFTETAEQVLKGYQEKAVTDLEQRQKGIGELIKPVKEQLEKVNEYVREVEVSREGAYSELKEQVKQMSESQGELRSTASHLVKVLGNTKNRSQWGEIQLRRVVEIAGMTNYCDFEEQVHIRTEAGGQRPDMIIRLPSERVIVVDAKAPMDKFNEAQEADKESERIDLFKKHSASLRSHVTMLRGKGYQNSLKESLDFVVLFLPNEAVYSTALEYDPKLIEDGAVENVIIATPATLIVLLKAVAFGWRQDKVADEVKKFSELGKQFYERLSTVVNYISDLGGSIENVTKSYNRVVGSVERRLIPTAKKFHQSNLVRDNAKKLKDIEPIDTTPRSPAQLEPIGESDGDFVDYEIEESSDQDEQLLESERNDPIEDEPIGSEETELETEEPGDEIIDDPEPSEDMSLEEFLR